MTHRLTPIDVTTSKLITLAKGAKVVNGPKKPNPHTLFRWHKYGKLVAGERIYLETVMVGNKLYTTREAVEEFIEAQSQQHVQDRKPAGKRSRAKAKRILDKANV